MWWMMAAQAGMAIGKTLLSRDAAGTSAKVNRKYEKYKNTMAALSAAQSQNAITTNLTQAMVSNADEALDIERARIEAEGAARVSGAAAGVDAGDGTVRAIQRNAAARQYARTTDLNGIFLQATAERRQVVAGQQSATSHSYIPKPGLAADLLGLAGKGLSIYNGAKQDGYID